MTAAFRITGKQPELWNAVTGETVPAKSFSQKDGRTFVDLEFDPYGSVFVVFKNEIGKDQQGIAKSNYLHLEPQSTLHGAWQVAFDPKWGGPAHVTFNELGSWTDRNEEGIRFYSGKAVYTKTFDMKSDIVNSDQVFLDLGEVKDIGIAKVLLNGKELGILWAPPLRVSVKGIMKDKDNILEIEVINTWRNRLIGDRGKPQDKRLTKTNITIQDWWQLVPSGLLGPVRILINE